MWYEHHASPTMEICPSSWSSRITGIPFSPAEPRGCSHPLAVGPPVASTENHSDAACGPITNAWTILNDLQTQLKTSHIIYIYIYIYIYIIIYIYIYISSGKFHRHFSDKWPRQDPSPVQLDPSSGRAATRHCLAPPQNRERDLKKSRVKMSTFGILNTKVASLGSHQLKSFVYIVVIVEWLISISAGPQW